MIKYLVLLLLILCSTAQAEEYTVSQLVDAIYWAEGGANTKHPYGILARYKHTTPRQACFNTVRHKLKDWVALGSKGDFLVYLASKYAPIGASNDPQGLNRNWLKNVRFYLAYPKMVR